MAINIQEILKQLKTGIGDLAKSTLKNYSEQAIKDAETLLSNMEADLKTWTAQLERGDLSTADFKDLVLGQKDLIKMVSLKQAGLAQIQIDQFKKGVLDLVVNTLSALV